MSGERVTDDLQGRYVVEVEDGQGLSLGSKVGIHATWTARIYWVRDADGGREHAWTGGSYYQSADPNKRRTRAQANLTLGRLRAHLKSTGKRWEVERDRERRTKEEKRQRAVAAGKAAYAAAFKAEMEKTDA